MQSSELLCKLCWSVFGGVYFNSRSLCNFLYYVSKTVVSLGKHLFGKLCDNFMLHIDLSTFLVIVCLFYMIMQHALHNVTCAFGALGYI